MHVLLEAYERTTGAWWVVDSYTDEADLIEAANLLKSKRVIHRMSHIYTWAPKR